MSGSPKRVNLLASYDGPSVGRVVAIMKFDYDASAELFMQRQKDRKRQPLVYRRFASAAEAIRFAIEEFPAVWTLKAWCWSATNASTATTFSVSTIPRNIRSDARLKVNNETHGRDH